MMTKKDYATIAEALRQARPDPGTGMLAPNPLRLEQADSDVISVADMLGGNGNFNRADFLTACGYFRSNTPEPPKKTVVLHPVR